MRILVVNPNTTASMTAKIAAAARSVAAPGTTIIAAQPDEGPVSIEGYFDEALSVPGMLEEIAREDGEDLAGHVIACFDDTGLDAARSLARAPVVGIGEAAYHMASLVAGRFSVVTTLSRSIPALEHNLHRYGLASRCGRVRAAEVPVLALEDPHSAARDRVSSEIDRAIREDRAEAIVLGCAGMADLARSLSGEHGLPVIEGVSAAVKLIENLATLGLSTSKVGGWATPRRKPLSGRYAVFSGLGGA
ncbi:aspartate/glutamate racemase family protein [Kaistia dalseonensis]|uniref:Allantoin racemase n=1 Tax=Kaistia dalseonensis TaxID=410840 RepID=A0ABU0HET6_9HYPH|nr:aspartate/glutamate racemase family protein [Kaistia dalseonensis]MCX5497724.1 aspartate/glutamate racemase family protein [Kaistia dalseonensis]MDQ0440368.1 allantoin racemase [Kaistia dalseonensis]